MINVAAQALGVEEPPRELVEADKDGRVVVLRAGREMNCGHTAITRLSGYIVLPYRTSALNGRTVLNTPGLDDQTRGHRQNRIFHPRGGRKEAGRKGGQEGWQRNEYVTAAGGDKPPSSATYVNVRRAFHEESPDIELCCSCAMQIKEWLKSRVEEGKKDGV